MYLLFAFCDLHIYYKEYIRVHNGNQEPQSLKQGFPNSSVNLCINVVSKSYAMVMAASVCSYIHTWCYTSRRQLQRQDKCINMYIIIINCVDLSIETIVGGNMMVVVIFCTLEIEPNCLFHKAIQLENCLPGKIKYLCLLACRNV